MCNKYFQPCLTFLIPKLVEHVTMPASQPLENTFLSTNCLAYLSKHPWRSLFPSKPGKRRRRPLQRRRRLKAESRWRSRRFCRRFCRHFCRHFCRRHFEQVRPNFDFINRFFSLSLGEGESKLEWLSLKSFFMLVYYLGTRFESTKVEQLTVPPLWVASITSSHTLTHMFVYKYICMYVCFLYVCGWVSVDIRLAWVYQCGATYCAPYACVCVCASILD